MKKRLLSLTLVMAMIFIQISFISVFAETTADTSTQTPIESAFTDVNFLNAVRTIIGKTNGEHIYQTDVENITKLNIERKKIADLAGIEYFTGLKEIYITANKLTELDFSQNKQLEKIDCSYNTKLASLNISQNSKLKALECNYAKLTDLDVSNNPELTRLICFSNKLRGLHIDKNPLLEELDAKAMGLPGIDMRSNPNLKKVNITQNYMTEESILLPEGITLESGIITYMPQKTSDLSGTFTDPKLLACVRESIGKPTEKIYPDDVNKITELNVEDKKLTSLDGIEHLQALETLNCSSNTLVDLDVSNNLKLQKVDCSSNSLTDLDISHNSKLQEVNCGANVLTDLDVSNNSELQTVDCYLNNITTLDFANNTELTEVHAHNNALEDINISKNAQLKKVDVSQNELSSINISGSDNLEEVNISNNKILSDEAIILSDKYPSNLMEIAKNTRYNTVPTDNARIKVFPQYGRFLMADINSQDNEILDVSITTAPYATFRVFDVTNCAGISEFEDGDMPYEDEFHDNIFENNINALKEGSIEQTINVHALEEGEADYEGTVTLDRKRTHYRLLIVAYIENEQGNPEAGIHAQAAQIIGVDIDPPLEVELEEFKINNGHPSKKNNDKNTYYNLDGKGEVFNVLASQQPRIVFYKYQYYMYIKLKNAAHVNKVFVRMSRSDNDAQIKSQCVELKRKSATEDVFVGTGQFEYRGEWSDMPSRQGQFHITYTTNDDPNNEQDLTSRKAMIIIDPSGYIYEGVPSNRLSNVETSIYYKGRNGEAVKWNAAEADQKNPIFTDKRGSFEWAVPAGKWQVKAEKEGYETYYTKWMPVPPAQMDVNFSMMSTAEPEIKQIVSYPDGIEIQFNKYMYSEDMTPENISVTLNGINIIKEIEFMDEEQDYWVSEHDNNISGGSGNYYVSRIKVKPRITLMQDEGVDISVNKNVRTYAGITMTENYENSSVVEKRPTGISVYKDTGDDAPTAIGDEGYSISCGAEQDIKIKITPVDSAIGKKLYLVTDNDWAVSLPDYVTIDNDGWATIPVEAVLPLDVNVFMYLEGGVLAKEITMSVVTE